MIELDWTAQIEVTTHARERALERLGWNDVADIRSEIRDALLFDRIAEHTPNWTRGIPGPGERFAGYVYVWDEQVTHCWVIARRAKTLVVATLLMDRDTDARAKETHHLRRCFR